MKVVHLITIDSGGAYTAVKRIIDSLNNKSIHSEIVIRNHSKSSQKSDIDTTVFLDTGIKTLLSKIRNFINLLFSNKAIDNDIWGINILKCKPIMNADIIFIHWVNSFLCYRKLIELNKIIDKPIVIVMHDMWHLTGGCHYSMLCENYKTGCTECGNIGRIKRIAMDYCISNKRYFYEKCNPYIITISEWEKKTVLESTISNPKHINSDRIIRIWNPIDTEIFKPNKKALEQNKTNTKPIILFGADRLSDEVKGVNYILEALDRMDIGRFDVICFGVNKLPDKYAKHNKNISFVGRIDNEKTLALLYNKATVFVTTPIQEAFGYTCCEALSCGTPVVAFGVGGILDQIEHKKNGYLVKLYDIDDLVEGITYCINNYDYLKSNARQSVLGKFDYNTIGNEYRELLCKVIEKA